MDKPKDPASPLAHVLRDVGYLGCWEIDYTVNRVRADGEVGPVFGIDRAKILEGVSLDLLDGGYQPSDLEMMKRARRSMIGVGGHTRLQYKLRHNETERSLLVESMVFVTLDREGHLARAAGTLFDISTLEEFSSGTLPHTELDRLAGQLVEAGRIARRLNLTRIESGLKPALLTVGRLLSKATVKTKLYH